MKLPVFLLVVVTGLLNIALNVAVRAAGKKSGSIRFLDSLFSREFGIALAVGTASVLCLLLVHRSELNLPQAIALMGAVSIVGGSLFGLLRGQTLRPIEVVLVVVIAVLFVIRWIVGSRTAG